MSDETRPADTPAPGFEVDKPRIERAVREILVAIGEDPDRDGLLRTPARIAEMYEEIFAGLHDDPARHLAVTFEAVEVLLAGHGTAAAQHRSSDQRDREQALHKGGGI